MAPQTYDLNRIMNYLADHGAYLCCSDVQTYNNITAHFHIPLIKKLPRIIERDNSPIPVIQIYCPYHPHLPGLIEMSCDPLQLIHLCLQRIPPHPDDCGQRGGINGDITVFADMYLGKLPVRPCPFFRPTEIKDGSRGLQLFLPHLACL